MANLQVGVAGNGTVTVGAGASVHSPASNTLTLGSNNAERLRIDSSGRLLIGTTTEGHANGDELTISKDSGAMGMTLRSGDSSNCHLYFSDATSGTGEYAGYIAYQHSDNSLQMGTNSAEKLRITSDGSMGLGTTPETDGQANSLYFANGNANIWGSGNVNLYTVVNARYTGTSWKYNNTATASYTGQQSGVWSFHNAPSGTADAAATFTERIRIGTSGEIGIAGANYGTSGQVLTSGGSGAAVSWATPSGGISIAQQWRLTSTLQANQDPLTGWELVDTQSGGGYGTSMSESSGIWTFPSTGWWLITFHLQAESDNHTQRNIADLRTTTNNSSYTTAASAMQGIYDYNNSYPSHGSCTAQHLFDVTDTSTHKVKLTFGAGQGGEYAHGSSSYTYTYGLFERLGDT